MAYRRKMNNRRRAYKKRRNYTKKYTKKSVTKYTPIGFVD